MRVRARRTAETNNAAPTFLAGIFGSQSMDVRAEAIAAHVGPSLCMFALSETAEEAFRVGGNGSVLVPNCGIQVNSNSSQALVTKGASAVVSQKNCVVGGWSGNILVPPTQCDPEPDPLAALPEPSVPPGPCYMDGGTINSTTVLPANKKYCGTIKVTGSATVTMENGIYYFVNATFELHNSASLEANYVMLYFDQSSKIEMASSGSFTITPMESGTYRGIAMFGSRKGSTSMQSTIGGGYSLHVPGAIYMPKTDLVMKGGSSLLVEAGYIIANTYKFQGTPEALITMNPGMSPTNLSGRAMLVR